MEINYYIKYPEHIICLILMLFDDLCCITYGTIIMNVQLTLPSTSLQHLWLVLHTFSLFSHIRYP